MHFCIQLNQGASVRRLIIFLNACVKTITDNTHAHTHTRHIHTKTSRTYRFPSAFGDSKKLNKNKPNSAHTLNFPQNKGINYLNKMLLYKRKIFIELYTLSIQHRDRAQEEGKFSPERRLILALAPFDPFHACCIPLRLTPRWSLPRSAQ